MTEIYEKAQNLLDYARKHADEAQVNAIHQKEKVMLIQNNKVELIEYGERKAYWLRIIKDKRMGTASSNNPDQNLAKRALKIARTSPKMHHYYGLPQKQRFRRMKIFDKRMPLIDFEQLSQTGKDVLKGLKGLNVLLVKIITMEGDTCILNTNGVDYTELETSNSIGSSTSNKLNINLWKTASERRLIDFHAYARSVADDMKRMKKPEPLKNAVDDIVFAPVPFSEIMDGAFMGNLDLSSTNSRFRTGYDFGCDMSITDKGHMDYGIMTSSFDDDGVPTSDTQLIKNGIINEKISDYQTAKRFRKRPTGNAGGFSNVVVSGKNSIRDIDKGVLVTAVLGEDNSNALTTEFSVEVDRGFMIENGQITRPVNEFMISGRFTDLMKSIAGYGKDVTNVHGFYLPSVHVHGLKTKLF
ncbi:TldD/PmbA family protein [Candidatus Woesearchaeota archaeon]|nr:TldD/PmbA family protein [Candidatus Woesearchaeota archaeon]